MSRLVPRNICVLLVVVFATVLGATAPTAAQPTRTIAGTQLAPDDVSLRIDIRDDGSAAWEVEYRVLLDDENSTAAFESVRRDIEANETQYSSEFGDRMRSTAATAENATGREMEIQNVSVSVSRQQLPQEYGVLTYRFVWTNFAVVDGDRLQAGDALRGLFLDDETSLLMTWPKGYVAEGTQPAPDDKRTRTVVWNGPLDFGPGEPSLVVASRGDAATTDGSAASGDGPEAGGSTPVGDGSDDTNVWLGGAGLLVAVAAVGGGWMLYNRREDDITDGVRTATSSENREESGATEPASTDGTTDAGGARPPESADAETAGAAVGTDDSTASDGDADAGGPLSAGGADDGTPPWEDDLLSNEERVLALMEHEGGRLKQQEVAQTLGWTDAKTSQVVRKMREADTLDAFRLGRENVLVLPDEDLDLGGE